MKRIVSFILLCVSIHLYALPPLVDVADQELKDSIKFMKREKHQKNKLYDYVRLLKNRYLLTRETVWVSNKISDAVYLQSNILLLREQ